MTAKIDPAVDVTAAQRNLEKLLAGRNAPYTGPSPKLPQAKSSQVANPQNLERSPRVDTITSPEKK